MRGCDKLEHVHLNSRFVTPIDPRVDMPLPRGLRKLTLGWWKSMIFVQLRSDGEDVTDDPELFELMKKHLPGCEIVKGENYDMESDPDVTFTFKKPEREPGDC